jgi:hypothetical protein
MKITYMHITYFVAVLDKNYVQGNPLVVRKVKYVFSLTIIILNNIKQNVL